MFLVGRLSYDRAGAGYARRAVARPCAGCSADHVQRVRNLNRDHLDSFGTTTSGENMYKGMNLVRSLRATIRHNGQRTAIIDSDRSYTWADFDLRVASLASALRVLGVHAGLTIWNTVS